MLFDFANNCRANNFHYTMMMRVQFNVELHFQKKEFHVMGNFFWLIQESALNVTPTLWKDSLPSDFLCKRLKYIWNKICV
jgi:hypothetical protein